MIVKPAARVQNERFPMLVEDIGEDPARFLHEHRADETKVPLALARIRGLESIQACNAWLAVERRLNGGRSPIVDAIEARKAYLQEHGEPVELDLHELARRHYASLQDEPDEEPDPIWRHEGCGETDVTRESSRTWYCNECEQRTNRVEQVNQEVAA